MKKYEIFKDLPNVFGIADDILVVGYDSNGKDHDETLQQVLQMCRKVNLKLNKDKCHLRCSSVPFFWEVISRHDMQPDPQKLKALVEMPPKDEKGTPIISWNNYLDKFSPSTTDTCKPLGKPTSIKTEWTWKVTYQMFNKGKAVIKEDACMKFYEETK